MDRRRAAGLCRPFWSQVRVPLFLLGLLWRPPCAIAQQAARPSAVRSAVPRKRSVAVQQPRKPADPLQIASALVRDRIDLPKADALLAQLLHQDARNAEAAYQMSVVKEIEGQGDQGCRWAAIAVQLRPDIGRYHERQGECLAAQFAQTDSTLEKLNLGRQIHSEFTTAVTESPQSYHAHNALELYELQAPWYMGGGESKAVEDARQFAQFDCAGSHDLQAELFQSLNRKTNATQQARAALQCLSINADNLRRAARVLRTFQAAPNPELLDIYNRALRLAPGDCRLRFGRGKALLFQTHVTPELLQQARGDFQYAIQHACPAPNGNQQALNHFGLGLAWEKLGRRTEAIREYRTALKLAPHFPQASAHLGALTDRTARNRARAAR